MLSLVRTASALLGAWVSSALLAFLAAPVWAEECRPPAPPTEWHAPKKLRQALEAFRQGIEKARADAEADRVNLGRMKYREAMSRYKDDIAAYFAGVIHAKNLPCPFAGNEVLSLAVRPGELDPRHDVARGNDVISLRIAYYYTGNQGDAVSMGAITLLEGASTGHWGYRPFRMQRGLGIATVRLGMNSEGPDSYRSDAVSVEMYIHGKNVFHQRLFPYIREWQRRKP